MTAKLEAASTIATKASYVASGGITFFGALTAQEFAALLGIALATLTYLTTSYINWYWRKKAHELEREELRLKYPTQYDDDNEDVRPG